MEEVTVFRTWDEPMADMAADLLKSEGIQVHVTSLASRSVHAFTIDGMGQIDIRVPHDQAERAAEIIAVRFSSESDEENSR